MYVCIYGSESANVSANDALLPASGHPGTCLITSLFMSIFIAIISGSITAIIVIIIITTTIIIINHNPNHDIILTIFTFARAHAGPATAWPAPPQRGERAPPQRPWAVFNRDCAESTHMAYLYLRRSLSIPLYSLYSLALSPILFILAV